MPVITINGTAKEYEKGISFEEGATGRDRNNQIGGHKA